MRPSRAVCHNKAPLAKDEEGCSWCHLVARQAIPGGTHAASLARYRAHPRGLLGLLPFTPPALRATFARRWQRGVRSQLAPHLCAACARVLIPDRCRSRRAQGIMNTFSISRMANGQSAHQLRRRLSSPRRRTLRRNAHRRGFNRPLSSLCWNGHCRALPQHQAAHRHAREVFAPQQRAQQGNGQQIHFQCELRAVRCQRGHLGIQEG